MSSTPLPRSQFPVTERTCYLNHAGVSPLPLVTQTAMAEIIDDFVHAGSQNFERWDAQQEVVRGQAARLMGVPADDVAFVKNTTEGLGFVANGLQWRVGDRVIVPDREFPSTIYPWLSLRDFGVEVDIVDPIGITGALPVDLFADALETNASRGGTKLVALSWVQYGRGYQADIPKLAKLCHEHGALLCVDVIQGLGVIPAELEAWGVDFAMADSHKWMLGPVGIGMLYVASDKRELLRPLEPGWASVVHRDDYDNLSLVYDDNARRFEGGTYNNITIAGMGASIDLLLSVGIDSIWRHVDELLTHLASGLERMGATVVSDRGAGRSPILTFTIDGHEPSDVHRWLDERHFFCSERAGGVRIAPHGYNTFDEMDALIDAVGRLAAAT